MTKIAVFFAIMFMSIYLVFNHAAGVQNQANKLNKQYAKYLTNATQDAAGAMVYDMDTNTFMATEEIRESVVRSFFNTLAVMFDADLQNDGNDYFTEVVVNGRRMKFTASQEMIRHYVPAILLVDEDGFYVWHSFYQGGEMHYEITPLTTWSEVIQSGTRNFYVRYYLHDKVEISVAGTTEMYRGTVDEVRRLMDKKGYYPGAFGFLESYEKYKERRDNFVAQSVQSQLMYYINAENDALKADGIPDSSYYFEMPSISSGDWIEMVENPSVISFLQGSKFSDLYDFINIYSFSGGEQKKTTGFVAKDVPGLSTGAKGFYHVRGKDCSIYGTGDPDAIFPTRRAAAEEGYDPCPECNP